MQLVRQDFEQSVIREANLRRARAVGGGFLLEGGRPAHAHGAPVHYRGHVSSIRLQQDGARPHTGKGVTERLNQIGMTLDPPIYVFTQAVQSPDHNINDLSFFRSLSTAVKKVRRGTKVQARSKTEGE